MSIDRESLRIWDRLVTLIEKATVDNPTLKRVLGQTTIKIVQDRTQKGIGVEKKQPAAFPGLKNSTKRRRRTLRKAGKLSSKTTPEKDNMTRTGKLTESLDYEIHPTGVEVKVPDIKDRRKLKNNPERRIMDVTKQEEQDLAKIVADEIVKALKKFK